MIIPLAKTGHLRFWLQIKSCLSLARAFSSEGIFHPTAHPFPQYISHECPWVRDPRDDASLDCLRACPQDKKSILLLSTNKDQMHILHVVLPLCHYQCQSLWSGPCCDPLVLDSSSLFYLCQAIAVHGCCECLS